MPEGMDMDEKLRKQLEELHIDPEERIEARYRARRNRPSEAFGSTGVGEAIIIAAVILVVGIWGGKMAYDYHQAKQIEQALQQFSNALNQSSARSVEQSAKLQEQFRQRQIQSQQETLNREKAKAEQAAQIAREKRLSSDQCRFWSDQNMDNPSDKSKSMVSKYCS